MSQLHELYECKIRFTNFAKYINDGGKANRTQLAICIRNYFIKFSWIAAEPNL